MSDGTGGTAAWRWKFDRRPAKAHPGSAENEHSSSLVVHPIGQNGPIYSLQLTRSAGSERYKYGLDLCAISSGSSPSSFFPLIYSLAPLHRFLMNCKLPFSH